MVDNPVGVTDGTTPTATLTDDENRYLQALAVLAKEDPEVPGQKMIEVYVQKQRAYTQAVETKTKAYDSALNRATKDPANATVAAQRAAYDLWVSENQRTYRNFVQAAYMDWVVVGRKESIEYWFAVVDNDSAMARVEASKVYLGHAFERINMLTTNAAIGKHARGHGQ